MSRSSKKEPYVDAKLLLKVERRGASGGKDGPIRTWARASEISPEMVGCEFEVHNGKTFIAVRVTEDMIGHRLGEFAPTRTFRQHGGKMQKELTKKAEGGK